jgi:hypothetical protein
LILYLTYHLHRISEACEHCPDARDLVLPEGDQWYDDDGHPKKLSLTYGSWKGAAPPTSLGVPAWV